jgi:hypothetical protein
VAKALAVVQCYDGCLFQCGRPCNFPNWKVFDQVKGVKHKKCTAVAVSLVGSNLP